MMAIFTAAFSDHQIFKFDIGKMKKDLIRQKFGNLRIQEWLGRWSIGISLLKVGNKYAGGALSVN